MRTKSLLTVLLVLVLSGSATSARAQALTKIVPDGKPHKFEARDHQFFIDGQPTMLIVGEMHLSRMLPQFWEQRMKQARAMGLNAVSLYLFWNEIQPKEGVFDFEGANDVRRFVKLAQENGLWVVMRPGPYCCAETEFGGIPWWLLKHKDIKIRSNDPKFLDYARQYINKLGEQVADLQVARGGPLIMVQLDNEYGRIDDYMRSLHDIFRKAGFDGVQLFTCDHSRAQTWNQPQSELLPDVMNCRNGLKSEEMFKTSQRVIGNWPVFSPEVYTAWFSIWSGPVAKKSIDDQLKWTNWLYDHNYSFSYYMFHGGTNWGYSNGSNGAKPILTSYDYDAPVSEMGLVTDKYRALRDQFEKRFNTQLPPIPQDPPVIEIPGFELKPAASLLDTLPDKPTANSEQPLSMEELDQGRGFVLYRKKFDNGLKGTLELRNVADYAITMVNGKTVGRSFVGYGPQSNRIELDQQGPATLDILVYNLGRVSSPFNQRIGPKGLLGGATLAGEPITGWEMYSLPLDSVANLKSSASVSTDGPTFYRGTFHLDKVGETNLDLRNWHFGVVWVNGHNLGRFWDIGALRSLYLPSVWQKPGENEIVILELHDPPTNPQVSGVAKMVEEPPKAYGFDALKGQP